jgi:hypothetical protein
MGTSPISHIDGIRRRTSAPRGKASHLRSGNKMPNLALQMEPGDNRLWMASAFGRSVRRREHPPEPKAYPQSLVPGFIAERELMYFFVLSRIDFPRRILQCFLARACMCVRARTRLFESAPALRAALPR